MASTPREETIEHIKLELAAEQVLKGTYKREAEREREAHADTRTELVAARAHQEQLASTIAQAAKALNRLAASNIQARQMPATEYQSYAQYEIALVITELERHIYKDKAEANQAANSVAAVLATRSHT